MTRALYERIADARAYGATALAVKIDELEALVDTRAFTDAELLDALPAAAARQRLERIIASLGRLPEAEQDRILATLEDAELLSLVDELLVTVQATDRADAILDDDAYELSYERECELRDAIADKRPRTDAGARAAARAVKTIYRDGAGMPVDTTDARILAGIVDYLTGDAP